MESEQFEPFLNESISLIFKETDKTISGFVEKIDSKNNLVFLSTRKNPLLSCILDFTVSINDVAYIRKTRRD